MKFIKNVWKKFLQCLPLILILGGIYSLVGDIILEKSPEYIALVWAFLFFIGAGLSFLWELWERRR